MSKNKKMPKAQDYGEPWKTRYINQREIWLVDNRDGHWIQEAYSHKDHETFDRIVACVNALKGCPDPEAFVARVREANRLSREEGGFPSDHEGYFFDMLGDPAVSWIEVKP